MNRDKHDTFQEVDFVSLESWLHTEVAATYDLHLATRKKAALLADAWKRFEARMDMIDGEALND